MTTPEPRCPTCPHPWGEHDGMGDCHHEDARTRTGYCTAHDQGGTP